MDGRGPASGSFQNPPKRLQCEGLAVGPTRKNEVAGRCFAGSFQNTDCFIGQGHPVGASRLCALSRKRPNSGLKVNLIPPRAGYLTGTGSRQDDKSQRQRTHRVGGAQPIVNSSSLIDRHRREVLHLVNLGKGRKDSWAAAVVDELEQKPGDIKVDKHRISGFWDTPLDSILRNLGTRTILFAGVNTDQCVLHSLADANFLGYGCILIEDRCATSSPDFCIQATLWNVKRGFGFVTSSAKILQALKK